MTKAINPATYTTYSWSNGTHSSSPQPTGSGFYPSTHSVAAFQPAIVVYPRLDTETPTWARHRNAYYDGTNSVQYNVPIGIATFGDEPLWFEILNGPSGAAIGQNYGDANYGRLLWSPTGSVTNQQIWVRAYDQAYNFYDSVWSVSTSASTSIFLFVDSVNGNDTTGTGSFSNPYATLAKALSVAAAGAIIYLKTGAYVFPISSGVAYNFSASTSAGSVIVVPGATATVDMSNAADATHVSIPANTAGNDVFMQGITFTNYNTATNNYRLISVAPPVNRVTLDQITWNGAGYGSGTPGSNATMVFGSGGLGASQGNYLYLESLVENGRASFQGANNYAGCSLYCFDNFLINNCSAVSTAAGVDGAWYAKSDCRNGCIRYCTANFSGTTHAFDVGQNQNVYSQNIASCYNTLFNGKIGMPDTGNYTFANLHAYRNNVIGSLTCAQSAYSLDAPYPPSIAASYIGGSLVAGTYYYVITSLGVTGESSKEAANGANEVSIVLTGTGQVSLGWQPVPGATGYNVYRGTASAGENVQYSVGNVTSWVDTGAAGTAASPPASSTAVGSLPGFVFTNNAVQGTTAIPSGAAVTASGNVLQASGLLNTTTGALITPTGTYGAQIQ